MLRSCSQGQQTVEVVFCHQFLMFVLSCRTETVKLWNIGTIFTMAIKMHLLDCLLACEQEHTVFAQALPHSVETTDPIPPSTSILLASSDVSPRTVISVHDSDYCLFLERNPFRSRRKAKYILTLKYSRCFVNVGQWHG